jgi:hypothetical protein
VGGGGSIRHRKARQLSSPAVEISPDMLGLFTQSRMHVERKGSVLLAPPSAPTTMRQSVAAS